MAYEVHPLTEGFGAEVIGLNLAAEMTPEEFAEVRDLYFGKSVVVFRGQELAPDAQAAAE